DPVAGKKEIDSSGTNLIAELLQNESLHIRLVVNEQDFRSHVVHPSRVSISLRSDTKSIGLVRSASAPASSALRTVSLSPYAVIIIIGTSGRAALALGKSSRPLMPGMLMSERIKIRAAVPVSVIRSRATGADRANSIVKRPL